MQTSFYCSFAFIFNDSCYVQSHVSTLKVYETSSENGKVKDTLVPRGNFFSFSCDVLSTNSLHVFLKENEDQAILAVQKFEVIACGRAGSEFYL